MPSTEVERWYWTALAVVGEEGVETLMARREDVVGETPKRWKEVAIWMGWLESGWGAGFAEGIRASSMGEGADDRERIGTGR